MAGGHGHAYKVPWERVKAVIFDVDGTLYDQRALHRIIVKDLIAAYLKKPSLWKDLLILWRFRRMRERMAEGAQEGNGKVSSLFGMTADNLNVPIDRVEECVDYWIMKHPLRYLRKVRLDGVIDFLNTLIDASVKIAFFSDYPAQDKLKALELSGISPLLIADNSGCLKPNPKGLHDLVTKLAVSPGDCLLIGDRDDRDGECARRVGMPYLIKARRPSHPRQFNCYGALCAEFTKAMRE